jgi:hypothetical protein
MSKLLNCPFCDDVVTKDHCALVDGGYKYGSILCGCGARGPDVRTGYKSAEHWGADAIKEWNTRAPTPPAPQPMTDEQIIEEAATFGQTLVDGDEITYEFSRAQVIDYVRALLAAQDAPTRHALQAQGTHPAPCARLCEANAYQAEIRMLKRQIAALEAK